MIELLGQPRRVAPLLRAAVATAPPRPDALEDLGIGLVEDVVSTHGDRADGLVLAARLDPEVLATVLSGLSPGPLAALPRSVARARERAGTPALRG